MIILCGPSASGKTEVAKLLATKYNIKKAITNTTRPIRVNEVNHVDYHFTTKDEFLALAEQGYFVETACYNNNYYGCAKNEVADNKAVILEPQGVVNFLKLITSISLCDVYNDNLVLPNISSFANISILSGFLNPSLGNADPITTLYTSGCIKSNAFVFI